MTSRRVRKKKKKTQQRFSTDKHFFFYDTNCVGDHCGRYKKKITSTFFFPWRQIEEIFWGGSGWLIEALASQNFPSKKNCRGGRRGGREVGMEIHKADLQDGGLGTPFFSSSPFLLASCCSHSLALVCTCSRSLSLSLSLIQHLLIKWNCKWPFFPPPPTPTNNDALLTIFRLSSFCY